MEYFMMNSNQVLSTELLMEKYGGLNSDAELMSYGWISHLFVKNWRKYWGERDD